MLTDLGYAAHVTGSPVEAVQACRDLNPAALLIADDLPGARTVELLASVKPVTGELIIILMCPRRSLPAAAKNIGP